MEPKKLKMDPSAIVSSAIECVSSAIVGQVAGQATQSLMTSAWNQIGNVKNCQEYISNLQEQLDKLVDSRKRIEGRVERARNNGEIVEDDVLKWLTKAHAMETEVEEFLKCKPGENKRLFSASVEKYDVGKEAKKKTQSVLGLMEEVGNFTEVSHPPPPPDFESSSSNDYESFQSRAPVFQEIMAALNDDEIKMIGVYGMGGVGKTRMVEEVGEKAKKDSLFDKVVITTISQSMNVRIVQGELADGLGLTLNKETESGRASQLCNRLKNGKKTLVIIDDVWKEINLKEIGIPIPLGDGCKIVLTSRSQGVCIQMKVQKKIEIGVLSKDEAWVLFQTKVGNSMFSSPEMRSVAEDVCRECGGLPVALLAVGAVLMKYKSKQYAWDDVLEQLRNSRLNKVDRLKEDVYSRLELSYDYLEQTDAKKCFLLCCLFREDAQIWIEELVDYGMGMRLFGNVGTIEKARNRVQTLVDNLKTSCLLLEGRSENHVKMHDVVRDVANMIASKNRQVYLVGTGVKEWPEMDRDERYAAISLWDMDIQVLPPNLKCPKLRVLVLEHKLFSSRRAIPPSFFNGMEKLQVLVLEQMSIVSSPESSISCLGNLRMLRIKLCNLVDISFLKGMKELENLSLEGSKIKEFGLEEIGELTRLRRLELRTGSELGIIIPTHVISNLSLLEELYISGMSVDSKGELEATNKDRCNTSRSVTFPKDRLFEKLSRFQVSIGERQEWNRVHLKLRRALCIYGNDPVEEHWVQVLLLKAEELHLRTLDLNNVFHDRDGKGFVDLEHLHIEECDDREYLLGEQKCVRFSKLSKLKIKRCKGMHSIIGNEEHDNEEEAVDLVTFPRLRWIALWSLPDLISFYPKMKYQSTHEQNESIPVQPLFNEKVAIPALKALLIKGLKMKDIWHKKLREDSFCHLKYLVLLGCDNLGNVFSASTAKSLVHLKKLRVGHCSKIEEIVAIEEGPGKMDKIVFHQLTFLSLRYLPALKCFCSSRSMEESLVAGENVSQQALFSEEVAFPCLEKLQIKGLYNLTEIWQSTVPVDSFCSLRELSITKWDKLVDELCAWTKWDKLVDKFEVYKFISTTKGEFEVCSSKLRARFPTLEKCEVYKFEYDDEDSEGVDYDDEDVDFVEDVDDVDDFDYEGVDELPQDEARS